MIHFLAVAALVAGSFATPLTQNGGRSGHSACPSELPRMRSNLMQFLNTPAHQGARTEMGLDRNEVGTVRLLSDVQDADQCSRLEARLAQATYTESPYRRAYYATENFYFVAIIQEFVPGRPFSMGHTPTVVVFDRHLTPLYATSSSSGAQ